jgi:hypothetical protein
MTEETETTTTIAERPPSLTTPHSIDGVPYTMVFNPLSGNGVSLGDATDALVAMLDELALLRSLVQEAEGAIGAVLVERMDRAKKWTWNGGGLKATAPSPQADARSYDGKEVFHALLPFIESGELEPEAFDAAVERSATYKVKVQGLKAIKAGGGPVAAAVDRLGTPREQGARRVTVKRKGAG